MNSTQIDLGGRSYWPADRTKPVLHIAMADLLERAVADAGDHVALVDGCVDPLARRRWTYEEMAAVAERVARALLKRFQPGERILMLAPNSAEWVLAQMGAGLAGLVIVTANPAYREREIQYVLETSGVVGVLVADEWRGHDLLGCVESLRRDIPRVREVIRFTEWDDLVADGEAETELPRVDPASPAQIQYTGGTTGFPKGVLLHHRGICNTPNFVLTQAGMQEGDVWINAMPLFHVGGCVTTGLGIVGRRGTHVVVPEFEPGLVLELIEAEGGNMSLLVPTMLIRVLEHASFSRRDVSSVHTMVSGAAPVPTDLIRRTKQAFDCQFTNIFGQTEVSGVVTTTTVDDTPEDQAETIGRAVPQVEMKIADPEDGTILPTGTEGEICARGHQMMIGYLDNPEATAYTLPPDGWLRTGDLGSMDDRGYLRITGRLKDMIIRGGENISPREIEEVLYEVDGIAEVVVLGVPDDELGEHVVAVVRVSAGATGLDAAVLRDHCRSRMAHFKAPALWAFVEEYPTTAAGKVEKFRLRRQLVSGELVAERPPRTVGAPR